MDENKQIEEMALAICRSRGVNLCKDCEGCWQDSLCLYQQIAMSLYGAGYRKQEWISVEERLPENDYEKHWKERQRFLVYTEPNGLMYVAKYGYKEYGWWSDGGGYVLDEKNYRKVTHWMPLPQPPKGE